MSSVNHASSKADLDRILGTAGNGPAVIHFDFPGMTRLDEKFVELAEKYKDIVFVRVNLEGDDKQFDADYDINERDGEGGNRVLPVFVFSKNGHPVKSERGVGPGKLEQWINTAMD